MKHSKMIKAINYKFLKPYYAENQFLVTPLKADYPKTQSLLSTPRKELFYV